MLLAKSFRSEILYHTFFVVIAQLAGTSVLSLFMPHKDLKRFIGTVSSVPSPAALCVPATNQYVWRSIARQRGRACTQSKQGRF